LEYHEERGNYWSQGTVSGDVFPHRLWISEELEDAHEPIVEGRDSKKQKEEYSCGEE
jgi:hypothetical protein